MSENRPQSRLGAISRRSALKLGAATVALGSLGSAGPARAARSGPDSFTFDFPDERAARIATSGWRTSAVYNAPRRFDLLGLGWRSGGAVEASVRARRRGGRWSRWVTLHDASEHGPDRSESSIGTDPVWTGAADQFQLRLRGSSRGLYVRFVHAAPAAQRAKNRAQIAAAKQVPGAPPIIPRAQWGGDSVPPREGPRYGQVQCAFVHHTVNANDYTPEQSAGIVLGIARYHRDQNGWNDIGYNFLVDRFGQIFEGRQGGIDQAIVGAQAAGFNSVSTGVACIGNYMEVGQDEAGFAALARIIAWKLSHHGVPVTGQVSVPSSRGPVTFERISGHRDANSTSCPGDLLYAQLPELRARAAGAAPARAAVAITARAARTTLRGTGRAQLSGVLKFPDGTAPTGAPVELRYAAKPRQPFATTLGTARCAADGAWSATVDLPRTGRVLARYPGDATHAPVESSAVAITLTPQLLMKLSKRRLKAPRAVLLTGMISPPTTSAVALRVERKKKNGRYTRDRRLRLPLSNGRYAHRMRLRKPGLYRITVIADGATTRQYVRVR